MRVKRWIGPGQWTDAVVTSRAFTGRRETTLADQVMDGYRRAEAKGQRIHGNADKIRKIWSN